MEPARQKGENRDLRDSRDNRDRRLLFGFAFSSLMSLESLLSLRSLLKIFWRAGSEGAQRRL